MNLSKELKGTVNIINTKNYGKVSVDPDDPRRFGLPNNAIYGIRISNDSKYTYLVRAWLGNKSGNLHRVEGDKIGGFSIQPGNTLIIERPAQMNKPLQFVATHSEEGEVHGIKHISHEERGKVIVEITPMNIVAKPEEYIEEEEESESYRVLFNTKPEVTTDEATRSLFADDPPVRTRSTKMRGAAMSKFSGAGSGDTVYGDGNTSQSFSRDTADYEQLHHLTETVVLRLVHLPHLDEQKPKETFVDEGPHPIYD